MRTLDVAYDIASNNRNGILEWVRCVVKEKPLWYRMRENIEQLISNITYAICKSHTTNIVIDAVFDRSEVNVKYI